MTRSRPAERPRHSVVLGGVVNLIIVGLVAVLAPELRRLDLGRRLVEDLGARPMAATSIGSNIGAAEVDPGLGVALDSAERHFEPGAEADAEPKASPKP